MAQADPISIQQVTESRQYEILLCLSKTIGSARQRQDLWALVTDPLLDIFNAQYYTLCLLNDDGKTHSPFLYSNEKDIRARAGEAPIVHKQHPVDDGLFDRALASQEPIIYQLESLVHRKNIPPYIINWYNTGIREMIMVRITHAQEPKGVLYLYAKEDGAFSKKQFSLLTGVTDLLGTSICNILANEKIERQLEEIRKYKVQLEQENNYLKEEQKRSKIATARIVGHSESMQQVLNLLTRVAGTDTTVLILGETGTGKELIARAIHETSGRGSKLMIKVNCASIPVNLVESELFGHEKGSFTGALERRIGKFELANNSTLFLDEIGELPLELQAKLLRAIQEKEIERIGGRTTIKVNVRIVVATNRNLEKEVAAGRFRSDLYYRLNVFPITLPPLRKRKEDIPALTSYFIERFSTLTGKKIAHISHKAMENLIAYSWPGNIRELEHLLERTVLLTSSNTIKEVELPGKTNPAAIGNMAEPGIRSLADMERDYILEVVQHCQGRISGPQGAAALLKLPPTTLISKMQKLGITKEQFFERKEKTEL